ncbi:RNA binding RNA-directed DNA polymerase [Euphorbia peplus]|nr:RNA binding RNA-directed DNA polymerase [Euphorbia peplus]
MDFKIFVWNSQGSVNGRFARTVSLFLKNHKPAIVILVETKCSGLTADKVMSKIGLDASIRVEAKGFSGGIWVLWNIPFKISVLSSYWQFIHLQVTLPNSEFFFLTAIYGSPNPARRHHFWVGLEELASKVRGPWVLTGDFNAILNQDDRKGGSVRILGGCPLFQEFMRNASLHDLGFFGPRFTWKRGFLFQRLDRALCNSDFLIKFPNATVQHLVRIKSDHRPILISLNLRSHQPQSPKAFRFIKTWMKHPDYVELVGNVWKIGDSLESNIQHLMASLKIWNRDVFGNINKHKCKILYRLSALQKAMESFSTATMIEIEQQLRSDLENTLKQEEDLWHQKSRCKWIQERDRNTAYFHNSMLSRRRRNLISGLKLDGINWCSEDTVIREATMGFYKALFTDDMNSTPRYSCQGSFHELQGVYLDILGSTPSNNEIKRTLFDMALWKAPGIDGIDAGVYQKHWDRMGPDICSFVKKAFAEGKFDRENNKTLIVLISKKNTPESFSDLGPISLCNVSYKIITKLIANRLKPLMSKLIRPHQTSFVAGRGITDNIIIAQEAIHCMRKKIGKQFWIVLKIDLEKAYDMLCWDFIDDTLQDVGIPTHIIRLIMFCISSSSLRIMWNGTPSGPILPTRGVRQGDHYPRTALSCVWNDWPNKLRKKCDNGSWKPLCFGSTQLPISHLFFADNLILFSKASVDQAIIIKQCLHDFCVASGHKVSDSKSHIFFSENTLPDTRKDILNVIPFSPTTNLGKYLGVPLLHSRITKNTYQYIVDGIRNKLSGWAANTLSLAGRVTLAKAVLSAIPYYSMQNSSLPVQVCSKIDELVRSFIWGSSNVKRKIWGSSSL